MRMSRALVAAVFVATVTLPFHAFSQEYPPPPPPPGEEEAVAGEGLLPAVHPVLVHTSVDTGAQFNISDDVIHAMGMSRSQFVDQLAAGIFPGSEVDLLIPTVSLREPSRFDYDRGFRGLEEEQDSRERLVAIQVKRFYQIPRFRVRSEEIDVLDQIFITDGEVYVELNFRPAAWTRGK